MEEAVGLLVLAFGLFAATGAVHHVRNATVNGTLERNVLIGLRTRATLTSDRAWEEGHRAAGPRLTSAVRAGYGAGAVTLVCVLAALAVGSPLPLAWIAAAVGYAALMAHLVTGTVKANAAARAALEEESR